MQQFFSIFARILGGSYVYYFVIAGGAFTIFYVLFRQRAVGNKIQKKQAGRKDFLREILHSVQSTFVMTLITVAVQFTGIRKYTLIYDDWTRYGALYFFGSVALALIIHDTYFYWTHRLMHHPSLFKRIHLLHHKSVSPSPWTSYSFHFLEAIVEGSVTVVLAFVLPMHPLAIALFILSGFLINVYGHLGYEIMPLGLRKSFLFEIINTSTHHNLHHSKFKGNYGLYFRVWDRLMGTENPDYVRQYDQIQAQRIEHIKNNTGYISSMNGK